MKVQAFIIGAFAALTIAAAVPEQDNANAILQRSSESANKYCGSKDERCSADDQCCSEGN
ncbi:unnamed protein product [Clonostachys rosea]|uniref:Uncharacterized protein n=1 Tax=Bionectria ochroleuca TaxID=29856 RepID=A0ABY6V3W4_BIOOC|nr:unnamed protein product [Clonostachys rosea]